MCRAVAYEPPSEEVTEALIVLARYVTTSEHPGSKEHPFRPAQVCHLLGKCTIITRNVMLHPCHTTVAVEM